MTRCKSAPCAAKLPLRPIAREWPMQATRWPNVGSMSRPGMEFMNDREVVACVDLVRRKDAIFAVDFEDGDRDHEVAGKLEGVGLSENEIV